MGHPREVSAAGATYIKFRGNSIINMMVSSWFVRLERPVPVLGLVVLLHGALLGSGLWIDGGTRAPIAPVMVSLVMPSSAQSPATARPSRVSPPRPPAADLAPLDMSAPGETREVASAAERAGPETALSPPRFDADYLENPAPPYPHLSRRLGEEGRVLVRVLVDQEGQPRTVAVDASSGYSRLDNAAMQTVRRWRFIPAKRGERPVSEWVVVPVMFSLRG